MREVAEGCVGGQSMLGQRSDNGVEGQQMCKSQGARDFPKGSP